MKINVMQQNEGLMGGVEYHSPETSVISVTGEGLLCQSTGNGNATFVDPNFDPDNYYEW